MQQLKFNENTKANKEILEKKNAFAKDLLAKKEIKDIIKKLNVTEEEFDYYLGYFLSYYEDRECCKCCKNLDSCSKDVKGTILKLVRKEDDTIEREYTLCPAREEQRKLKYVDERLLKSPTIALMQVKKEVEYMANVAKENLRNSLEGIKTGEEK